MKKLVLVAFLITFFTSCEIISFIDEASSLSNDLDENLSLRAKDHELYDFNLDNIHTFEDIANYISNNIEYRSEEIEEWSDPLVTINRGYGDCDDFAILFANIAYYELNKKCGVAAVYAEFFQQRKIVKGGRINHLVVWYNGNMYSPYTGELITDYPPSYVFEFDEVFIY